MPKEELRYRLIELRGQGVTCKGIARQLDYSAGHVSLMCSLWNIRKQLKSKKHVDRNQVKQDDAGDGIRASAVNANTSAASEATPSDSPLPGTHP